MIKPKTMEDPLRSRRIPPVRPDAEPGSAPADKPATPGLTTPESPLSEVPELHARPASGRTRQLQFSQKEMRRRKRIAVIAAGCAAVLTLAGSFALLRLGAARSYPVRILDRGRELEVMAEDLTVAQVLSEAEIELAATDIVSPALTEVLPEEGAVISIRRSFTVTINAADGIHKATLSPGETVADDLARAGFTVTELDDVTPPLDTVLSSAANVEFVKVTQSHVIQELRVEYQTIVKDSSAHYVGQTVVDQKGVHGVMERTLLVTSRDGQEVSRSAIKEEIVQEPVDKIVLKGVKPKPTPTPRPTPAPTRKPSSNNNNNKPASTPKPTTRPQGSGSSSDYKVPGAPGEYLDTLSMEVTAYTHTGRKTATGTWPRWSRSRENPGTVAVAPQTIPYHTLLYITGYGYAIAEDTGGFRHDKPMMLDCFMNTTKECIQWGRRRDVKVYIIAYDYKYKG